MSTVNTIAEPLPRILIDPFALRRFSILEYHEMIDAGILKPDDRVELLEGWIVKKMSQKPPHSSSVTRVSRRLARLAPDDWTVRVQCPITLSQSEPEPDIALARGDEQFYDNRHPTPSDIGVLIEVGDSTFLEDRRYKGAVYARERIPEFWLIDVRKRKIEVHTKPRGGKFQKVVEYTDKESVPLILDGVKIADIPVSHLIAKS